jgi:hypothetical protein
MYLNLFQFSLDQEMKHLNSNIKILSFEAISL